MRVYELTIVLSGKVTKNKKKSIQEKINKLVNLYKGKIKRAEDWGEIPLGQKIGKETSGNFLFFNLELDQASVKAIKAKLALEEEILRHLLVGKENDKEPKSK